MRVCRCGCGGTGVQTQRYHPLYKQNPANTGMRKGITPLYKQNPANNKAATNNEGCGYAGVGTGARVCAKAPPPINRTPQTAKRQQTTRGAGMQVCANAKVPPPFINRTPQTTKRQQTTRGVGGHGYVQRHHPFYKQNPANTGMRKGTTPFINRTPQTTKRQQTTRGAGMQVRKGETRHGGTGVQTQRHHPPL